ncbi:unnamed protein product [Arabidopsis halleri]
MAKWMHNLLRQFSVLGLVCLLFLFNLTIYVSEFIGHSVCLVRRLRIARVLGTEIKRKKLLLVCLS